MIKIDEIITNKDRGFKFTKNGITKISTTTIDWQI